jgi:hypothetical protein
MRAQIASILLVAFCSLTPAFAQDPAQTSEKPSQVQIDAAKDLLLANNTAENVKAVVSALVPAQEAELRREHPTISDETIHAIIGTVQNAITSHTDELISLYAIAYARHFSVEEMHALAAFYRSEPGQKYLKELPGLVKETTPVGITYLKGVIMQEVQQAIEKMRKQGMKI